MVNILMMQATQVTYASDFEPKVMNVTCYCPESCSGEFTAIGTRPRYGICASSKERLGQCAMIYEFDENEPDKIGDFVGYFMVEDTGKGKIQADGRGAIEHEYVLDVWQLSLAEAKAFMKKTKGKVTVIFVDGKG